MYEERFTDWLSWRDRNNVVGIRYPGIYVCAITSSDISDTKFSWLTKIVYIGMTNAISGLKGRLKQFDNTILGKTGHGGADRVRFKHQNYEDLCRKLFVSVVPFECNVKSNHPGDLRIMGTVAKFEYNCFAHYVEVFGSLPEFNNKATSPKYSLTLGRGN
ncbi:MAG: hypothetical protein OEZ05_07865 [Nitrospirota bacterium]|nr:hypothetical protein [Nitrospirota bacterium]